MPAPVVAAGMVVVLNTRNATSSAFMAITAGVSSFEAPAGRIDLPVKITTSVVHRVPIAKRSAQRYGNVGHNHRNGTLDRGLDTKHGVFVILGDDRALAPSPVLYFDSNFFLS